MATYGDTNHSENRQKLPPATPVYVLRGHEAPIHALNFFADNTRLVSGDAEGWVIIWDTGSKRPSAAWRAHEGAILGVEGVDFQVGARRTERRVFTYVFLSVISIFLFVY